MGGGVEALKHFAYLDHVPVAEMGMLVTEISTGKVRVPLSGTRHK